MAETQLAGYLTLAQLAQRSGLTIDRLHWARRSGKLNVWRVGPPGPGCIYLVDARQWAAFAATYKPRRPYRRRTQENKS